MAAELAKEAGTAGSEDSVEAGLVGATLVVVDSWAAVVQVAKVVESSAGEVGLAGGAPLAARVKAAPREASQRAP